MGRPPLPGGVAAVLRFFFNLPQWFQIGGFFVGLAVAAWLVVYLWRRRLQIVTWIKTRQRGVKIGLVTAAALVAIGAAGFGTVSWTYMQHDNAFCTGCHIMADPFQRFAGSKHDSLSCHNCHQQSMFASMRQLYLWVAARPNEIGKHAKVPTRVCASCHVTGQKEKWQRIATTAGHRVHLESDSSALKDVQCTTCHGVEVHRFVPVDSTCGQSGCHIGTQINLGKMASQTGFHCIACHQFTAEVPLLATRDSAAGTLRPGSHQCFGCHEMRAKLADFDPARDPHRQTCGMCHNPHEQRRPADALRSCTTAGCHSDWRDEPFHTGKPHARVAEQCTLCHQPHGAKVDAAECAECHAAVKSRTQGKISPPQPFDTTRALRRVSELERVDPELRGKGDANPPRAAPAPFSLLPSPSDSFPHARHKQLACLTCHVTSRPNAELTFVPPRGCQICHHQTPGTTDCAKCHAAAELAPVHAETIAVAVGNRPARPRSVSFAHSTHAELQCTACHETAVTLDPSAPVKACSACHDDHHTAKRDCATCHTNDAIRAAHPDSLNTHEACDACHREATVARLVPDRGLCFTCHADLREHHAARECTTCHFQTSPDDYRAHLRKVGA